MVGNPSDPRGGTTRNFWLCVQLVSGASPDPVSDLASTIHVVQ